MCTLSKPTNGTNNAQVFLLAFDECVTLLIVVRFKAHVNGKARSIQGGVRRNIAEVNGIGLAEMYSNNVGDDQPLKVSA